MQSGRVCVAIFAKAPIPGFGKTRLTSRLGPGGAARLQTILTRRAVQVACQSCVGPVSLWCTPATNYLAFQELATEFPITLHTQHRGDLGARMCNALCRLTINSPALLIGTDSVVLESSHLIDGANALLAGSDAVFVPVEDGGYLLAGLRRCRPALFNGVPWNTSSVMEETRRRAAGLGLTIAELEMLWDIDLPADYDRALALGLL